MKKSFQFIPVCLRVCIFHFKFSILHSFLALAFAVWALTPARAAETQPPTIQVLSPPPGSTVNSLTQIVLSFSEPVSGLEAEDLLINGEPAFGLQSSGNSVYTFTCSTPLPGFVSVYFDIDHGITDLAGNAFDQAAPGATWFYTVADSIAPLAARLSPPPGAVVRSLSAVEVFFSEPVNGVTFGDLLVNGFPSTNVIGAGAGPYRFSFASPATGNVSLAWANDADIRDQNANLFGGGSWSITLNPSASDTITLNEFLAANESAAGLRDEDNELHDWIELHNFGSVAVNLTGWSLSNEAGQPRQWVFPPVTLNAGHYLVVFASAKNRAGLRLHSNFQLSSRGEHLALYTSDEPAMPASAFIYPEQRIDHSYGATPSGLRYFSTPTPGAPNSSSALTNLAQPVHFSVERSFFNAPFNLVLATPTLGATIRYTLDGSVPTAESGFVYARPLTITNTTPVRAVAFSTNTVPSLVRTHTYIFPEQVLRQPAAPAGFPTSWITQNGSVIVPADYAMDQRVVNNPAYSGLARQGLTAIPTLSIVMRTSDLFGQASGIYSNPRGTGLLWERPASAEFIFNDRADSFHIDAGYRIQGGSSREENKSHKHSQRLLFRGTYGAGRLEKRLFEDSPVESFDTLVVDAGLNLVWTHRTDATQRRQGQYVRDQFMSDLHNAMGWPAFHGRFFHLYLNGLYWGLHGVHERPEEDFAASYFGSTENDWDIIKNTTSFEVLSGDLTAWNAMRSFANSGLGNPSQYQQIQQYLDLDSLIDYMILNIYGGNTDWPHHNWYAGRRRNPAGTFKFFNWDAEHVLKSPTDNRSTVADANSPAEFYNHLRLSSLEFRLRFADHVHKHFFNNGVCASNQALARYMARIREIDPAIVLESARWGDNASNNDRPNQPYERNVEWLAELGRLTNSWFPQRSTIVLNQFRSLGLYPNIQAPTFNQHGGRVPRGFDLTISAGGASPILFTTNGVDPRVAFSGAIAPDAAIYSNAIQLTRSSVIKARTLAGTNWSALTEAQFTVAELTLPLRITEIMYNPVGGDAFEFIELRNIGDTDIDLNGFSFSGITYVFPAGSMLAPGATLVLASNADPNAFAQRYPGVLVFGYFADRLANGGERIAIKDSTGETIISVDYDDEGQWPFSPDGVGHSLEVVDAFADPDAPANWRASSNFDGSPGTAGSPPPQFRLIRLNEVMAINTGAVSNAGRFPEWIELFNPQQTSVDISGWSLSDDSNPRSFVFPTNTVIAGQGYLVVWCDSQIGITNELHAPISLSDRGESIFLYDASTNRIDAVSYGLQVANYTLGALGDSWVLCSPTPGGLNSNVPVGQPAALRINEWLANAPPGGSDWLELYNTSPAPVPLGGLYLGSGGALFQFQSHSFLRAGGYVQLLADELPGVDHLDIKLSASGGDIALYDQAGVLRDRITYGPQLESVSEGRLPNGDGPIQSFPGSSTPGAPNFVSTYSGPRLSEIMARNVGSVTMTNGLIADWVELHNPLDADFDLSGMRLSIDVAQTNQWIFPPGSTIPAHGHLVVWCTSARPASMVVGPELNSGQGIDAQSGAVYLFNSAGQLVDHIEFGFQPDDYSIGRSDAEWQLLAAPTPGAANSPPADLGSAAVLRINEWMAAAAADEDWFELYNSTALPISLSGLYLTDDPSIGGVTNYVIAQLSFIGPNSWVRIFADSDPSSGRDHVNFQLHELGETIRLYDSNLQLIDSVDFGASRFGVSQGRLPDGFTRIVEFPGAPTPADANYVPLPSIVINELLVNPDGFTERALELYNSGSQAIDISDWWLSDSAGLPRKYRVPAGTIVPPGGFKVFYATDFDAGNTNVPIVWRSGSGEVWLSQADEAGNLSGARAMARYGPLPFARSYGVTPCTGPGFVALRSPTLGAFNSAPGPIDPEDLASGPPYIAQQPLTRVAIAGSTVMLHVGACGDGHLAYQWFFNDAALADQTNAVFTLPNVQPQNAGGYYAIVTNALGAVTSQVAQLTLGTLPVITAHPQSRSTNEGSTVTFNVGASGSALTYQWRVDAVPIPGATNATLTLTGVTLADSGDYSVLVSGSAGNVASDTAKLLVTPIIRAPPAFTGHPVSATVFEGGNVTFSVDVTGTPPVGFRWRRNGLNFVTKIDDPTLTITNVQLSHAGVYNVVVTNALNASPGVISSNAILTVLVHPEFLGPRLLAGGVFEATLRGSTGRTHVISRSTDLLNWSDFQTFTSTNLQMRISDPTPGSNRFYRARLLQ
jgi:hypothetical protein